MRNVGTLGCNEATFIFSLDHFTLSSTAQKARCQILTSRRQSKMKYCQDVSTKRLSVPLNVPVSSFPFSTHAMSSYHWVSQHFLALILSDAVNKQKPNIRSFHTFQNKSARFVFFNFTFSIVGSFHFI